MATITVRALDANWDPIQGNGQACFLADLDAMVQIVRSRLLLFKGEWFLNLNDGLPMFNGMLGSSGSVRNIQIITNMVVVRIKSTPYVIDVDNVAAAFQARSYYFSARVITQFGSVYISTANASSASLIPQ